jgi:hypothetical protein
MMVSSVSYENRIKETSNQLNIKAHSRWRQLQIEMTNSCENRANSVMAESDPIIISLSLLSPFFSISPLPLRERIKERGSPNRNSPSSYPSPVKGEGKKKNRETIKACLVLDTGRGIIQTETHPQVTSLVERTGKQKA